MTKRSKPAIPVWRATKTSPMPPMAKRFTISYLLKMSCDDMFESLRQGFGSISRI